MAAAWPNIEHLHIWAHMDNTSNSSTPTLMGLLPLSRSCPRLRNLALAVDATTIRMDEASRTPRVLQTSLVSAKFFDAPITSPSQVADFLSSTFPAISRFHTYGTNPPPRRLSDMDPFASDTAVDSNSVLKILRHHLLAIPAPSPGILSHSQLSAALLFDLCSTLAPNTQVSAQRVLPRVLAALRDWRLLPEDERVSSGALEELAKKLMKLSIPAPPFSRATVPLIWISSLHAHPRTHTVTRRAQSPTEAGSIPSSRVTRTSLRRALTNASCEENTAPTRIGSETEPDYVKHDTNARTSATSVVGSPTPKHAHPSPRTTTSTNTNASPLSLSPLLSNSSNVKSGSTPALAVTPFVSSHNTKPRPWPLPEPGTVVLRQSKPSSTAVAATSTPPRVVLGHRNALD
ncbi:hypothetical protein B0H16DRAFT_1719443 [Mycena metata]|uniref:Uncharacterized protein n=1 Tax=Mycena metata TaxID=1033252 RepID=A0AAD7JEI4_9AGAR|nr:hypothetical protein B0H16DRAFT_1719443 [Mycena metata]